ncbi:BTAD domain-containing putative transcriptional regulator [Embleya sp. NPDC050493]|uniref:AfsR/SARP family transcriptional regulator n=1 Tax=Embleya sp. NPDC050493 TaxID=3363989 RepID=UPI00378C97DB
MSSNLWGDRPPATASSQIYTYISRLRKLLGPAGTYIVRRQPGYALSLGSARFDHEEFERLSRMGHTALTNRRFEEASRHLAAALRLWRGPALANVTEFLAANDGPWLEEARMRALEARIEADIELGLHARLVPELTALVESHPVRERMRTYLMTALYRCDRQADALEIYQQGRHVLAEQLGVDPGHAMNTVFQGILEGDPVLARSTTGAGPRAVTTNAWSRVRPAMLPPDVADFTGRHSELEVIETLLRAGTTGPAGPEALGVSVRAQRPTCALGSPVAITGMAGIGKTALAMRAAYRCLDVFPDGQLQVDLGGLDERPKDPGQVLAWFLRALNTDESAIPDSIEERIQLYRSRLAGRRMLILLDNARDESQIRPLLPGAAGCRVLITSRCSPTALDGVSLIEPGPLSVQEGLELLSRVAGEARIQAEREMARRLVELCGGLPLAVRIAAVRLHARPHWQVASLVVRMAAARGHLDELRTSDLDVRFGIRQSYRGLEPRVRRALCLLTQLDVPDFPLWAAAEILRMPHEEVEDVLEALVDARLLSFVAGAGGTTTRYRLHRLVRIFGREEAGIEASAAPEFAVVLDRALNAWVRRGHEAQAAPVRDGERWLEDEKSALVALFRQVRGAGKSSSAWELGQSVARFLDRCAYPDERVVPLGPALGTARIAPRNRRRSAHAHDSHRR